MSEFFGFKLCLTIENEFIKFIFTKRHVNNWDSVKQKKFPKNIKNRCRGKEDIGLAMLENLYRNDIQFLSEAKNNIRNSLISITDKILLRKNPKLKRAIMELKNSTQIKYSRYHPSERFIANSLIAITTYYFFDERTKKPAINNVYK